MLAIATFAARQSLRRNLVVFVAACVTGFFAQLPLGAGLNRYTPNIHLYLSYVSVAVILTWGVGLVSIFAAHALAARLLRTRESAALFGALGLPILVVVEITGSNLVRMKLHNYGEYAPLMPGANAMHAPAWLYAYYIAVAFLFYRLLRSFRVTAAPAVAAPARSTILLARVVPTVLALAFSSALADSVPQDAPIDLALNRMYNFDFKSAQAILDDYGRTRSADPLLYSVRAAAHLFSEFNRMGILESEFFGNDDRVGSRKTVKPDPAARAQVITSVAEATRRAQAALAADPADRNARFALCMALGVELEYSLLVEKRYLRSYSLSKQSQQCARALVTMDPPFYDAYMTIGTTEYVVGSLNPFFRFFVRFDQIRGDRRKGIEILKLVTEKGRYYRQFARIMLGVAYLREKQYAEALATVRELERELPENPLFRREAVRIAKLVR